MNDVDAYLALYYALPDRPPAKKKGFGCSDDRSAWVYQSAINLINLTQYRLPTTVPVIG